MTNKFKGLIAAGILSLFMVSCDSNNSSTLSESFDRSGEELRITVIFHPNQSSIDKAYREEFGRDNDNKRKLGFAVWADPGNRPYWCRIHAQKPTKLDDEKTVTLGHELTHCLIGTFHPE